jgi:hypothetical protein
VKWSNLKPLNLPVTGNIFTGNGKEKNRKIEDCHPSRHQTQGYDLTPVLWALALSRQGHGSVHFS